MTIIHNDDIDDDHLPKNVPGKIELYYPNNGSVSNEKDTLSLVVIRQCCLATRNKVSTKDSLWMEDNLDIGMLLTKSCVNRLNHMNDPKNRNKTTLDIFERFIHKEITQRQTYTLIKTYFKEIKSTTKYCNGLIKQAKLFTLRYDSQN